MLSWDRLALRVKIFLAEATSKIRYVALWKVVDELRRADESAPVVVQIGANTGNNVDDPVWVYAKRRAVKGVLVEPHPTYFAELVKNYKELGTSPNLKFEQAAIADAGDGSHVEFRGIDERSSRFAENPDYFKQLGKIHRGGELPSHLKVIKVPCLTPARLLAKHGIERIDVVFTDVEGFDNVVLRAFDFGNIKPTVYVFESIQMSKEELAACNRLLESHGYVVFGISALDNAAVLESALTPRARRMLANLAYCDKGLTRVERTTYAYFAWLIFQTLGVCLRNML